jgi:hypothetical protein
MLRWIRKRRKKLTIAIGAVAGVVLFWLLFPPSIHSRLKAIRLMQSTATSQMSEFLEHERAQAVREPDVNADFEELDAYFEKQRRGPLADMPLEFDVNRYFEALDRLRMDDGYTLDYVYCTTSMHAYPLLYARLKTNPRLSDVPAFEKAFGKTTDQRSVTSAFLDRIRTDGSRQGFIQLAALYLVGDQFYLFWHANYNDTKILSRIPAWVVFSDKEVSVSLFVFSKWGGVARYTIRLKRSFPHEFVSERKVTIIPYNCGIRF